MTNPYPPLADQSCGSCLYRRDSECRRRAPNPRVNTIGESFWPNIGQDGWCGEWVALEAVK